MATQGTVTINIVGDARRLRSALGEAESGLAAFSTRVRSVGDSMMQFGSRMTIGVTLPLALAGKAAFDAASDLSESLSKVNVVFADSAAEVRKWSQTSATSFGLSRQAALEATGTFGNLFRALGVATQPAADMSRQMVTLAADLASFNNVNIEDALVALRSGLVGEAEPLRRFGVSLSEARVEAKALEMGLGDLEGNVSDAAKVQARYQIILEDTALAQGDFARTADGAANKQRILRAQFENTAAQLGTSLIPIFQQVAEVVTKVANWFSKLEPRMQRLIVIGALAAAAIGPLVTLLGGLVTAIGAIISPVGLVVIGIGALIAAAVALYLKWDQVWNWIKDHPAIAAVIALLTGPVTLPIFALVGAIRYLQENWGTIWPVIQQIAQDVWAVLQVVFAAIQTGLEAVGTAARFLYDLWQQIWPGIRDAVLQRYEEMRPLLSFLADQLRIIADAAFQMAQIAAEAFRLFAEEAARLWNAVDGPLGWLLARLYDIYNAARDVDKALRGIQGLGGNGVLPGLRFLPGFEWTGLIGVGAEGAIVNRPTMALIGEAGPEALVPLHKLPGNRPVPDLSGMAANGGPAVITIPLVVDGRVLAEVTASELNRPGGPLIKQRVIV